MLLLPSHLHLWTLYIQRIRIVPQLRFPNKQRTKDNEPRELKLIQLVSRARARARAISLSNLSFTLHLSKKICFVILTWPSLVLLHVQVSGNICQALRPVPSQPLNLPRFSFALSHALCRALALMQTDIHIPHLDSWSQMNFSSSALKPFSHYQFITKTKIYTTPVGLWCVFLF